MTSEQLFGGGIFEVLIFGQAFALLLAVVLRALGSNARKDYDSDDEFLAPTRTSRQPLLNRQTTSGTSTNASGSESRPARADAWSTRMREKVGIFRILLCFNVILLVTIVCCVCSMDWTLRNSHTIQQSRKGLHSRQQ